MSFGKIHAQMYEGSMFGAGLEVMAIWPYMLARADKNHRIEMNPKMVAAMIGCSVDDVTTALGILESPDPESRSKEHEGRRIVKEGEYMYFIPNRRLYCAMQNDTVVQAQGRIRQRRYRWKEAYKIKESELTDSQEASFRAFDARRHGTIDWELAGIDVTSLSRHVDVDVDVDVDVSNMGGSSSNSVDSNNSNTPDAPRRKRAVAYDPPSVEDVAKVMSEKGVKDAFIYREAEKFVAYYDGQDWRKANGQPLTVWKSAVAYWVNNNPKIIGGMSVSRLTDRARKLKGKD